jgi:hypothetical protein
VLLGVVVLVFVFELVHMGTANDSQHPAAALTGDTYKDRVSVLLQGADPYRGGRLIDQYECWTCHRAGAVNHVAPSYEGIAGRAAARRPPLTAAAYLYESIVYPMAYVVEGYSGAMPQDYGKRLSDRELGDIIAYLLTPDAQ